MVKFEDVKSVTTEEYFNGNQFAINTFSDKYSYKKEDGSKETPAEVFYRVASTIASMESTEELKVYWAERWFDEMWNDWWRAGGSIMSATADSKGVSSSNCTTTALKGDSLEEIFATAYRLAKDCAYRQGIGVDFSKLRPRGMKINNSAKISSGAVHWMKFFDGIANYVGQSGRIPALLLSLKVDHPDIVEFIKAKSDTHSIQNANISVQITDAFMKAVATDSDWELKFSATTGETLSKTVKARDLMRLLSERACKFAEPGVQFIDMMQHWQNTSYVSNPETGEKLSPISSNACITGDTEILTANGYTKICDLAGNDVDLIDSTGSISRGSVWFSGVKPTVSINYIEGRQAKHIICTEDHKFMTNDGAVVEAKDLAGKQLMPFYSHPFSAGSHDKEYVAMGFIQGDGTVRSSNIEAFIGAMDFDLYSLFGKSPEDTDSRRAISVNEYRCKLKDIGFQSDTPLPERGLPSTYSEWDKATKAAYLCGMFSANGYALDSKNFRIGYKTSCSKLRDELVATLLSDFGIEAWVTTSKPKAIKWPNGTYVSKEAYDINIGRFTSMVKFINNIGFVQQYKMTVVDKWIVKRSPYITSVRSTGDSEPVYDFNIPSNNWGVIEGFVTHNCSEKPLYPDSVCVLGSVNMERFSTREEDFIKELEVIGESITRFLDNVITFELTCGSIPIPEQWKVIPLLREIGCGITNLQGWLLKRNLPYDSNKAIELVDKFTAYYTYNCYKTSHKLAMERGSFGAFSESFFDSPFVKRLMNKFTDLECMRGGMRNSMLMSVAPTGTLSLTFRKPTMSTGIEPVPGFYYWKRARTSGAWKWYFCVPESVRTYMASRGIDIGMDTETVEDPDGKFGEAMIDKINSFFGEDAGMFRPAHLIDPFQKVKLMSKVGQWIDSSISTTYNLPETANAELVEKIYMEAWKQGVKSVAVYVDKSRQGVIEFEPPPIVEKRFAKSAELARPASVERRCAPKRPKELPCDIHQITVNGKKWVVLVGMFNGEPFEVFAGLSDSICIPSKFKTGKVLKNYPGSKYSLVIPMDDGELLEFKDMGSLFHNDEQNALTRQISLNMRTGTHIQFIVEQLKKGAGSVADFAAAISRVLSRYVKQVANREEKCPNCGNETLDRSAGCVKCTSCGWSRCD